MVVTAPHRVGNYLDRAVWCAAIEEASDFGGVDVRGMLVLLHTGGHRLSSEAKKMFAVQIVRRQPLATFFVGDEAEAMFEFLLRALDAPTPRASMMTNFSGDELAEAVDAFLLVTWPPDDRWDEWAGYLLVNVGGPVGEVEEAAGPRLDAASVDPFVVG